jgi:CRP-like cAMP-binding protein
MYIQLGSSALGSAFQQIHPSSATVAHIDQSDALIRLEPLGTRRRFQRGQEIYGDGDLADCWYRVVSGCVRLCKLLMDGRRHIARFSFPMTTSVCPRLRRTLFLPKQSTTLS